MDSEIKSRFLGLIFFIAFVCGMVVSGLMWHDEVERVKTENAEFRQIIVEQSELIGRGNAISDELFKMVDELLDEEEVEDE